ncbi:thermonuclease family protein [Nocardioides xinjiangensis]|uniref:thermonuclease family protein n=1 Tax=Nocardioides xinjiangensis TaxID=2817376 RepID=UPI001B3072CB|nr:thermonuclease family protein [Nocardioides sp. SYSU D00778]
MNKHMARALTLLMLGFGLATFTQPAQAFYDRDCSDFPSQAAAQNFFLANGGPRNDPHRLDDEGDGIACESNPCPCIGRGNENPQQPTTNNNPGPTIYRETGNVVRVVDGDTLKVRLRKGGVVDVRMLGINTPERGRCGYGEATDNLRRLAPVGSTVNLVSDRTQAAKDRYGRLLRYVARQGGFKDLSYRQAWNGYTKRYVFGGKPVARDGQYVKAINNARNNIRGLWNTCW